MNSLTKENYLKALFSLSNESGEVNVNDLSRHLGIKMPTVTSMMKKLAEMKLVHYESYKPIRLTTEGRKEAGKIIRKHRLTEMFLVEKMGFGWEEVHQIAEEVEHIHSPDFFARMDELLGNPKFDPHGSPIPDREGNIAWTHFVKLSDCEVGSKFKVCAVLNSTEDFLRFLNTRSIKLGTVISLINREPFDGSMNISFGKEQSEIISFKAGERLLGELC